LNVRIICATNQPLERLVEENRFRADLFYRLNVLSVMVPPLKARIDDIVLLVNFFITQQGFQKEFDKGALQTLKAYDWRGNVRELKNVIERTCILTSGSVITADDLSFLRAPKEVEKVEKPVPQVHREPDADEGTLSLKEMERRHIIRILGVANGHKGKAAEILEINPKTLYLKMRTYNIMSVYE
jgi:DNA-binding NtrC family response regulator